jgi:hypothetical protein
MQDTTEHIPTDGPRKRTPSPHIIVLAVLLAGAIGVRLWLMLDYRPAFVGFSDTHDYLTAALVGVFHDVEKPAGYPIFLRLVHPFGHSLTFTILVQHTLGIATGLLLYEAVRHSGAPAWLGLAPAAVVFFGGTGLLLEHSLLADPLYAFLQALGLYAAVRALAQRRLRWALLAGLATGACFWVKAVGLANIAALAVVLACLPSFMEDAPGGMLGAPGPLRRRVLISALATAAALALAVGYVPVQALVSGYWGYQRQDAWNLYGRVATFVDCSRFTPPARTRFLCPSQAPSERLSESFYQFARAAPAVKRYGGPAHAPASANAALQRFSLAAIAHQPLAYARAILRSLGFYISPRPGEGYTPQSIREALVEPKGVHSVQAALSAYYPHAHGYTGSPAALAPLDSYERHTRIQGALLIAISLAALAGPVLLRGRARACAALFLLTAVGSLVLAAAGNSYDARYGYPAFGPLTAAAALGAWALATRVTHATGSPPARPAAPAPQPQRAMPR